MNYFTRQKISNHPIFPDVERYVQITEFFPSAIRKRIEFFYKVEYWKDGEDVTHNFNQNVPKWIVDNSYKVVKLDENGDTIPNPDYIPKYEQIGETEKPEDWDEEIEFVPEPIYGSEIINEDEQNLQEWAYDYFRQLTFDNPTPVRIEDLMEAYVQRDDLVNKRFDF